MEVDSKDLLTALSKRIIAANGEVLQKAHTLSQAEVGRDALAKVILFLVFFLKPLYNFTLFRQFMIVYSLG